MKSSGRNITVLIILALFSALTLMVSGFIGMKIIPPHAIVSDGLDALVFWQMRVPRVVSAFLAGSGLALCGMVFQALFRNPLADPFTLGTASGASCGAAITILAGWTGSLLGVPLISIGAFLGAVAALVSVNAITSLRRAPSTITMLLAGVAVSFLFSSMLMFFQYISNARDSFQIVRWLMGGIQTVGFAPVLVMAIFWAAGAILVVLQLPKLDQLLAGEDLAHSRGVNVVVVRRWLLAGTALLIGGIVAICGPIGFIGLMVPHLCRKFVSASHLWLAPACILLGGSLLVIADTVGRTIIAPAEMPVGVLTALLGGPFFLALLFRGK